MKLNSAGRLMLGALLLLARAGVAGTLQGSAHDFSTAGWNSGQKICIACHTPHNSSTAVADAPLWNHTLQTTTYTLYTSPTLKASVGQPGGNSKLCLSCHDGTVAIDSFGGATGTNMITSPAYKATSNLGTSLNNDHPIGFLYDATLASANGSLFDPASKTITIGATPNKTGTVAATMLFNGKMECSSCHDVHNTFTVGANGTGMVKMASAGSAICLACHNK
jgi:predicted CXXCH cytochrome family protein